MAKKLTPQELRKAEREQRRARKAAALPPIPGEGGAYVVGADGALTREAFETPSKEA